MTFRLPPLLAATAALVTGVVAAPTAAHERSPTPGATTAGQIATDRGVAGTALDGGTATVAGGLSAGILGAAGGDTVSASAVGDIAPAAGPEVSASAAADAPTSPGSDGGRDGTGTDGQQTQATGTDDTDESAPDPDPSTTDPSAGAEGVWDRLAACETGGRWSYDGPSGYDGGLQFHPDTWIAYGGGEYAPTADRASRAQQITVAERVQAGQGWDAWPACAAELGLG